MMQKSREIMLQLVKMLWNSKCCKVFIATVLWLTVTTAWTKALDCYCVHSNPCWHLYASGLSKFGPRQLATCAWALSVLQQQRSDLFWLVWTEICSRQEANFSNKAGLMQLHQVSCLTLYPPPCPALPCPALPCPARISGMRCNNIC